MRQLNLVVFPVTLVLCITKAEWRTAWAKLNVEQQPWPLSPGLVCDPVFTDDGWRIVVALNFDAMAKYKLVQLVGLIAHEATHVLQGVKIVTNDMALSDETEACIVECVSQWLAEHCESDCQLGDPL